MAIVIDRANGQNYAENVVNPALSFNDGTWTVASGTGTAVLDTNDIFLGSSSLKIENTVPASDIVVTNSSQTTTIDVADDYQLSWFIKKDISLEVREGAILIYKNAVLLDTQTFSIGNTDADLDINDTWLRFQADVDYTLAKSDEITFQIRLDSSGTAELTTFIYVDGFMLNRAGRNNTIVPFYQTPLDTLAYGYPIAEPTVPSNSFLIWNADSSGTKDGTVYEANDVLLTVDAGGTSKTVILADYSAL